jgi:Transposase DDE domain
LDYSDPLFGRGLRAGAAPQGRGQVEPYPPPTPGPRSSRGWDGGKRTNGVKRHLAVDVNGLLLAVVGAAASIQDRDAAHRQLAALRGSFCTIGLVWADGGYPGRLLMWAKDVLTLTMQIIKRIPGTAGFPRPAPHLGGREKFRADQQAPPLRA